MWIIEQQQNDYWDEIEFHLRSDVFAACCTSSCFSLKSFLFVSTLGGPEMEMQNKVTEVAEAEGKTDKVWGG